MHNQGQSNIRPVRQSATAQPFFFVVFQSHHISALCTNEVSLNFANSLYSESLTKVKKNQRSVWSECYYVVVPNP
jgi:hypothetical protein